MKNVNNLAQQYALSLFSNPVQVTIRKIIEDAYIKGFQKCDEFIDMTLLKHPMNTDIIVRTHKGSTYFGKFVELSKGIVFRPDLTDGESDLKYEYIKECINVIYN